MLRSPRRRLGLASGAQLLRQRQEQQQPQQLLQLPKRPRDLPRAQPQQLQSRLRKAVLPAAAGQRARVVGVWLSPSLAWLWSQSLWEPHTCLSGAQREA